MPRLWFTLLRTRHIILICVQLFLLFFLLTNNFGYFMEGPTESVFPNESENQSQVVVYGEILTSVLADRPYPGPDLYTYYATLRFQLKPFYHVQPLIPEFGLVLNDVTSFRYPISIASCTKARHPGASSLFVAVVSAPNHFNERKVIRETWGRRWKEMQDTLSHVMEVVGFAFVVGQQSNATVQSMLEEEASACDDILQIDMVDVYYNLSMKAAALLNWMKDDCRHADFLLKVDDDVYINWHNLTTIVSKLSPSLSTYYGIVGENLVVDRGYTWLNGKWRSSYESWPWRNHPNFTQGASVLMSGGTKSVYRLLAAAQTIPNYHLDDIYLWGVCAVKASLTFQQIDGIYTHKPNNDSCFISNHSSWLTESEEQMRYYDSVTRQFYASKIKCS